MPSHPATITLVLASAIGTMACSPREITPEPVRETRQADVKPHDATPVSVFKKGRETAIAFTPPQPHPGPKPDDVTGPEGRWVIGFIDETLKDPDTHLGAFMGWAWSNNPSLTGPNAWHRCNAESGDTTCVPGGSLEPNDKLRDWTFRHFDGDPRLVANGKGGVVYVDLATYEVAGPNGTSFPTGAVVASLSTHGGADFGFSTLASDDIALNADCANIRSPPPGCACHLAKVDHPDATFDMTVDPPALWVVWRSKQDVEFGLCSRKGHIEGSQIKWDSLPLPVTGLQQDTLRGNGAPHIQAGLGSTTIVYPSTDEVPICPDTGLVDVNYDAATSYNGGVDWTNEHVVESLNVEHCLVSGTVQENNDNFSYVRVTSNLGSVDYAAFHTAANQIRIFSSLGGHAWRELCGFVPFWFPAGSSCPIAAINSPSASVFFPELSVDGDGRLGLFYYESNPDTLMGQAPDTLVHAVFRGSTAPLAELPIWQGDTPTSQLFGPAKEIAAFASPPGGATDNGDEKGPRVYGDYEAMTTSTPTATCGPTGTFHAAFVVNDGSDEPEVVYRQITLSPP